MATAAPSSAKRSSLTADLTDRRFLKTPLLWTVVGLSLLWTAVAAMDWWDVSTEETWYSALTLQSLHMGEGWTVDLFRERQVSPSPLGPLLGELVMMFLPSAPMALWALGVIGVGLFALGAIGTPWLGGDARAPVASALIGLWCLTLWVTHPLLLSSLRVEWPLAIGFLVMGAACVQGGRERVGWLLLGLAALGRVEMLLGVLGVLLWRWSCSHTKPLRAAWLLAAVPCALWWVIAWVRFSSPWPLTWASADDLGRSWLLPPEWSHRALLVELLRTHLVWSVTMGALAVIGLLTLRRAPALVWAGGAVGLGCTLLHGALGLSGGAQWWLYLGPLFGLVVLGAAGLSWLLSPPRNVALRVLGAIAAATALGSQWAGPWPIRDWHDLRDQHRAWQEVGAWLRADDGGVRRIGTTQPATLLWNLGVAQRLSGDRVVALAGPLCDGAGIERVSQREVISDRDMAERIAQMKADELVLTWPADEAVFDTLRAHPNITGEWTEVHRVDAGGSWHVAILRKTGDAPSPEEILPAPSFEAWDVIAAVNDSLNSAISSGVGWEAHGETAMLQGQRGLDITSEGHDGGVWTPAFEIPAGAVEAVEIRVQIKEEAPKRSTQFELAWTGDEKESGGEGAQLVERLVPVASSWRFHTYRFELAVHPRWHDFTTVRRLRLRPANWPFRATLESICFVPLPLD